MTAVAGPSVALRLSPTVIRLEVGGTADVLARVVSEEKWPFPGMGFEWAMANTALAQLDAHGGRAQVTALCAGKSVLTVTAGPGLRGSAEVIIERKGARKRRLAMLNVRFKAERVLASIIVSVVATMIQFAAQSSSSRGVTPRPTRSFATIHQPQQISGATRTRVATGEVSPLSEAFGFAVQPGAHPDSGDAAFAFKHLLISIRDHDVARVAALSTAESFGPGSRYGGAATALIKRAAISGVSLRHDDPSFVRAAYRAVTTGKVELPFFVELDDPMASRPSERHGRLHFTATITSKRESVGSDTRFHLDSISSPAAPYAWR